MLCVDYFPLYIQYLAEPLNREEIMILFGVAPISLSLASEAAFFYVHFYPAVAMLVMESPARLVGWLRLAWR